MKHARPFFLICSIVFTAVLFVPGCSEDEATPPPDGGIVPITADLFPLVVGRKFTYEGYATAPSSGSPIPDPTGSYNTVWTVGPTAPTPLGGTATVLLDTTTGPFGPGGAVVTVPRTLMIRKDSASGDFFFMQNLGPFKRAFGIPIGTNASDTLVFLAVARPSQGVGSTGAQWTAYDSTFTGTGGTSVRLQIVGRIVDQVTITDSAATPQTHTVYRSRTSRNVTLGGSPVQTDAETSQLWLEPNTGPIQVRIVEDPENPGHWRFLKSKNF